MTEPPGLAFRTLGEQGQDVVLIHGFGSDRLSWLGIAPALAQEYRVHTFDLPAHGDNPAESLGEGGIAALMAMLAAELDRRGMAGTPLVGHSLGGAIALLMARRRPDLAGSLVMLAPAGLGRGLDRSFLERLPTLQDAPAARELLEGLVARPALISEKIVERLLAQLGKPGIRAAWARLAARLALEEPTLLADAGDWRLNAATMVIWGDNDKINPPDAARLARLGVKAEFVAGAGHLPHVEASREVIRLVRHALAAAKAG